VSTVGVTRCRSLTDLQCDPTGRWLITKLLTNQLAQSRSTADASDHAPASGPIHRTSRLSMAWKKVAKDTVALLSTEAGRYPYDLRLSALIGELSTRSDELVSGGPPRTSRPTAPASSSSTPGRRRPRPVARVLPIGRPIPARGSSPTPSSLSRPRSTPRVSWFAGP
jgi:MmyB-like transcription regulator ligand binding domain